MLLICNLDKLNKKLDQDYGNDDGRTTLESLIELENDQTLLPKPPHSDKHAHIYIHDKRSERGPKNCTLVIIHLSVSLSGSDFNICLVVRAPQKTFPLLLASLDIYLSIHLSIRSRPFICQLKARCSSLE